MAPSSNHGTTASSSASASASSSTSGGPATPRKANSGRTRSPSGSSRHATPRGQRAGSGSSIHFDEDEDSGLRMRERGERDFDDDSIGRAGGVETGVTRPKRRLSSTINNLINRPAAASTPPITPPNLLPNGHPIHPHPQASSSSRYHALSGGLSGPGYFPRMDEKGSSGGYAATPTREKDGPVKIFGLELKWISLITLALQNAFLTIIMHYSRISVTPNKAYSAAAAVLLNELLKGSISILIALYRIDKSMAAAAVPPTTATPEKPARLAPASTSWTSMFAPSRTGALRKAVFSADCYKLAIPAILYVIQNNLQYVAASNLDVATFQVTYQMKILTTAFFSVLMLRKRLSKGKWSALVMLAVGVAIVQIQSTSAPSHSSPPAESSKIQIAKAALRAEIPPPEPGLEPDFDAPLELNKPTMRPWKGFVAVISACMTSGLAGVYFELILKSSGSAATPPPDLWVRNAQLSLYSVIPALVPIVFTPPGAEGVGWLGRVLLTFRNFNGWAIGTVLTQTFGGLVTAVVIRYSDNIMKGFATSLSIIISFLASVALFSYPITVSFLVGSSIVLLSTYIYNSPASSVSPAGRKEVAVPPSSPIGARAPIIGEPEPPSRVSSVVSMLGLASRKSSSTDLRSLTTNGGLGFTPANHAYAASAPGSPYSTSTSGYVTPLPSHPPSRPRSPSKELRPAIVIPGELSTERSARGSSDGGASGSGSAPTSVVSNRSSEEKYGIRGEHIEVVLPTAR